MLLLLLLLPYAILMNHISKRSSRREFQSIRLSHDRGRLHRIISIATRIRVDYNWRGGSKKWCEVKRRVKFALFEILIDSFRTFSVREKIRLANPRHKQDSGSGSASTSWYGILYYLPGWYQAEIQPPLLLLLGELPSHPRFISQLRWTKSPGDKRRGVECRFSNIPTSDKKKPYE